MCLAIPARIVTIDEGRMASADIMGVTRKVSLDLVPEASVGDFVLVHAGFALQVVEEEYANETLDLLRSIPELADELGLSADEGDSAATDGPADAAETPATADLAAEEA